MPLDHLYTQIDAELDRLYVHFATKEGLSRESLVRRLQQRVTCPELTSEAPHTLEEPSLIEGAYHLHMQGKASASQSMAALWLCNAFGVRKGNIVCLSKGWPQPREVCVERIFAYWSPVSVHDSLIGIEGPTAVSNEVTVKRSMMSLAAIATLSRLAEPSDALRAFLAQRATSS